MKPRPPPLADDVQLGEDDSQPLIVPRSDRALAPIHADRVQRLRKHLQDACRALPVAKDRDRTTTPPVQPAAFVARVARTACTLCRGWCCKGGGEHAYLDEGTLARLSQSRPGLGAQAILPLYLSRVPESGYQGSCIFHGPRGCTLDPSLRSDVCNDYFCGGLGTFVTRGDATRPVIVFAGEGAQMRKSPILKP